MAIINRRRCARNRADKEHHRIILSFDFMEKRTEEAISRYRLSRSVCLQLICSVCHYHSFTMVCLFILNAGVGHGHSRMPTGLLLRHIFHVYLSQRFDLHCNHISIVTIYAYTRYIINSSIHHTRTHTTAPLHSLCLLFLLLLPFFSLFMVHILIQRIHLMIRLRIR